MEPNREGRVVLVTGASRGIGLSLCIALLHNGDVVYGTVRNVDGEARLRAAVDAVASKEGNEHLPSNLRVIFCDVTKEDDVLDAVNAVILKSGRIDVLVNNAGYGLFGTVESCTVDQAKDLFETNVWGVVRVTQAVMPHFRAQRHGRVIVLSSMSGVRGLPFLDFYNASKFAIEGMFEAFAPISRESGVFCTLLEPGPVRTGFVSDSMVQGERVVIDEEGVEMYAKLGKDRLHDLSAAWKPNGTAQEVKEITDVILDILKMKEPPLRLQPSERLKEIARKKFVDISGDFVYDGYESRPRALSSLRK